MLLNVNICSPPDREKLVAAIMVDREQFAEINQESDKLILEVYPRKDGMPWIFSLDEVMKSFSDAKTRLAGCGDHPEIDVVANQSEGGTDKRESK